MKTLWSTLPIALALVGHLGCSTTTTGGGGTWPDTESDASALDYDIESKDSGLADSTAKTDASADGQAVSDANSADLPDFSGYFDDIAEEDTDAGVVFNPDAACVAIAAQGKAAPASILFVLDYSWSMCMDPSAPLSQLNCATDPAKAKWSILVEAMKAAVPTLPDNSYSAMVYYPDVVDSGSVCKVAQGPKVALALTGPAGSAQRMALISKLPTLLTDNSPVASTPTGDALQAMYAYYANTPDSATPGASRYIVLITDGKPTCAGSAANAPAAITAAVGKANLANPAVHTFVVGVPGSEGVRTTLSQAAKAGGTASTNCSDTGPNYCHFDMTAYPAPADLASHLAKAFAAIQGQALSCDYKIPPNPKGGLTHPLILKSSPKSLERRRAC